MAKNKAKNKMIDLIAKQALKEIKSALAHKRELAFPICDFCLGRMPKDYEPKPETVAGLKGEPWIIDDKAFQAFGFIIDVENALAKFLFKLPVKVAYDPIEDGMTNLYVENSK